jgi:hypothetical protein
VEWVPAKSGMLSAVAYNGEWHHLYLKFRSGDIYCYREVPLWRFRELRAADCKGLAMPRMSRPHGHHRKVYCGGVPEIPLAVRLLRQFLKTAQHSDLNNAPTWVAAVVCLLRPRPMGNPLESAAVSHHQIGLTLPNCTAASYSIRILLMAKYQNQKQTP